MKRRVALVSLVGAVTAALTLAACGSDTSDGAGDTKTITLGVNESLSGDFRDVGLPPTVGVRLAVDKINKAGGVDVDGTTYKLAIAELDNRSEASVAVANANELLDKDIHFVFGPTLTNHALQAAPIYATSDVIAFSASRGWQVEGYATESKTPLMFNTMSSPEAMVDVISKAAEDLGAKRIGVLGLDDDSTKAIKMVERLETKGFKAFQALVPPADAQADLSPYLTRLKAHDIDVLLHWTPQATAPSVLKLADNLKVAKLGYMAQSVSPDSVGRLSVPYVSVNTSPSLDYPATDAIDTFAKEVAAFAPELSATKQLIFYSHDFVGMLVEAMQQAKSTTDVEKIATTLKGLKYQGVAGDVCFGSDDRIARYAHDYLVQSADGEVKSVVFDPSC